MRSFNSNFFTKSYGLIPKKWRNVLHVIIAGTLCTSLLETGTMGCIALFISAISNPDTFADSTAFIYLKAYVPDALFATHRAAIFTLGTLSCVLLAGKNLVAIAVLYIYARFSAFTDAFFGGLLLKNFLNQKYEWHVSQHSTDLITTGSWRMHMSLVWYMGSQALNDILLVVMLCLALVITMPGVALGVCGVMGGLAVVIYKLLRPFIDAKAKQNSTFERRVFKETSNVTQGIKEIIISANRDFFFDKYQQNVTVAAQAQAAVRTLTRIPSWLFETMGFFMMCGVLFVSMLLADSSSPSDFSGRLALIAVVAWRAIPAFNRIVNCLSSVRDHLPKAEAVLDSILANTPAHDITDETTAAPIEVSQQIALRNISFTYLGSDTQVLHDITTTIRTGETVGLIGRSGSGKSTLADITIGLLQPTAGQLLVDTTEVTPANAHNWVANVGYVGQAPFFTDGSIAENVAFGIHEQAIDRERLLHCCRMAALDELIAQLPGGIDYPLGERAGKLSGGQRQRVAIARALYRAPQLLILDEATSALDQQSENAIQTTINNLAGSLTMLIIAHRLSTVESCDRLIWLEHGKVVMDGTPAEVLPRYQEHLDSGKKTSSIC